MRLPPALAAGMLLLIAPPCYACVVTARNGQPLAAWLWFR